MIVAIGGPPGSGKSTTAELYAKTYDCALVSAGAIFREQAGTRRMSLEEFGTYAESHPEVDRFLDDEVIVRVTSLSRLRDVVSEGRLQAALFARRKIPALKVLVDAPILVRAERVAERDSLLAGEAHRQIVAREASERTRYLRLYGVDANDPSHYDLILDSSRLLPAEIVSAIRKKAKE